MSNNKINVIGIVVLTTLLHYSCTTSSGTTCERTVNQVSRELGANPVFQLALSRIDTNTNYFCDSSLVSKLRADAGESDSIEITPVPISALQVLTYGPYSAKVGIKNKKGAIVYSSTEYFGIKGEGGRCNSQGEKSKVRLSWIFWNMRDSNGNFVPDGVYSWDVEFSGYLDTVYSKILTGVVVNACDEVQSRI